MSASLNTGEQQRWQNGFDSQFTCNISDSSTLGSCWAVLPSCWGGEPSPVCDSRVGRATLCAVPRATYWSESDRVSVSTNLRYSRQPAVICVYEGVHSVRIDWEQLYTGNCRQNADLQKVEQAVVKSVRCRPYGFVDAEQTDAAALRKDWDIQAAPLSHLGAFTSEYTEK